MTPRRRSEQEHALVYQTRQRKRPAKIDPKSGSKERLLLLVLSSSLLLLLLLLFLLLLLLLFVII